MYSCNNVHNTRIKTGILKRKVLDYSSGSEQSDSDSDYIDESDNDTEYDNENDSDYSDNDDSDDNDDNDDEEIKKTGKINKLKYYKFLNKLFPSNYSKNKINNIKRQRLYSPNKKVIIKLNGYKYLNNSIHESNNESDNESNNESDNESNNESDNESDNESNNESDNENILEETKKIKDKLIEVLNAKNNSSINEKNINIVLNMNGASSKIYNNKDKNVLDNIFEINEPEEDEAEEEEDENVEDKNEDKEDKYNKIKNILNNENIVIDNNLNDNNLNDNNLNDSNKCFSPISKKLATKNYKEFSKILDDDDNEEEYFKKNLSKKDQLYYIIKLKQLKELTSIEKPYLIHLMNLDIPDEYKGCALRKINILRAMGSGFGNSEYYKIKSWIDAFIKIPFNKYNNLPITFADGIDKCHDFMENAKKILDKVAFGLEDAKIQIMQIIGLWLVNPNAIGSAIAIKGPPGTGKTTLIKEGISKILNRPFAMIALGGCGDSGFLDGHDYTYEGSKYGKIIDILIQSKSMNPVILFDELDKLSDTPRGQEITGVLTHLTDSTQNSSFTDKYMSEISLDMSKALYIFSYNDESLINPILKDRMYKIETKGYKEKDKLIIAKDYLLPKIREQAKYQEGDIKLNDTILEYIIKEFTENESGVRNLKRCLEIVHTKLNLYRLMKPDINLFENSEAFKVKKRITFPCTITKENIDDLLIKGKKDEIPFGMYN